MNVRRNLRNQLWWKPGDRASPCVSSSCWWVLHTKFRHRLGAQTWDRVGEHVARIVKLREPR